MTRLLIIGNELERLAALIGALRAEHIDVEAFTDVHQALDYARRSSPALVLAELRLRSTNGYVLLRTWREDVRLTNIPFAVYAPKRTSADEELLRGLGAAAWVDNRAEVSYAVSRIRDILLNARVPEPPKTSAYDQVTTRLLTLQDAQAESQGAALDHFGDASTHAERLGLSIRAANIGLWDWDLRTNKVLYSREWKRQLGYEDAEISDEPSEWRNRVHADDLPIAIQRIKEYLAAPEGAYEIESRMLHRDGTYRWIRVRGEVIRDAQGTAIRMLGSHQDITERRLANEAIVRERDLSHHIVNSLPGVFTLISQSGRFLRWNENFERVTGYNASEIRAMHPFDFVRAEDREFLAARLQHSLETTGPTESEFEIVAKDGRATPYFFLARGIHFDGGLCLIGVGLDVSERKRAEEARRHLEAQLRQAQKMDALGTLAGGIAHDFNNLLGVILGNAQLARNEAREGRPLDDSLTEILRAGQRAKDLVKRILAFGRPQEQVLQPLELGPVLEDAVRLLRSTLPASVELTFRSAQNLPRIRGDASQIHQVVLNLATNAWHALQGKQGCLAISCEACEIVATDADASPELTPGHYVCLTVSDTGTGMDADTQARIFEPFFTTKPAGEGTGLGLPVVHGIVRHHGGSIVVDSEVGRGTDFRLYFPVCGDAPEVSRARQVATLDPIGHGERILYLDDEEPLVYLAERFLGRLGYRVTGFTRPADALSAFKASPDDFDLVITDSNMPGMSGLDVVRELKRIRSNARIVLTSGYLRADEIEQARALGVQELVLKPNTMDEFGPIVRRLLEAKATA